MVIRINKEYASLVPQLSGEEFENLKQSIKEFGQHVPIALNAKGEILDGHNRFRACAELGVNPLVEVKQIGNPLIEKLFVIDTNLRRRHLTAFQRGELVLLKKPLLSQLAMQNSRNSRKKDATSVKNFTPIGRVDEALAKEAGMSHMTLSKVDHIMKKGTVEIIERARRQRASIDAIYNDIKRIEYRQKAAKEVPRIKLPSGVKLVNKNFNLADEDSASIDLILSDPPYTKDALHIYAELAKLAMRVLKQGGSMVVYAGHHMLPEIMNACISSGLKYWWIFALKHSGASATVFGRQVMVGWKPLLWFVKGERPNCREFISDYLTSRQPDKMGHDWQQGTEEAEYLVKYLTYENQIVADYCMGSGTTGVATLRQKRRFVGYELEKEHFETARRRIAGEMNNGR